MTLEEMAKYNSAYGLGRRLNKYGTTAGRWLSDAGVGLSRGVARTTSDAADMLTRIPRNVLGMESNVLEGLMGAKENSISNYLKSGVQPMPISEPPMEVTHNTSLPRGLEGLQPQSNQGDILEPRPLDTATVLSQMAADSQGVASESVPAVSPGNTKFRAITGSNVPVPEAPTPINTVVPSEPTIPESRTGLFNKSGMSKDQLIRMAGGLARSIAPNEWGGRMGNELVNMADASIEEQRQLDMLKYAQDTNKFNTADSRAYQEKVADQNRGFESVDKAKTRNEKLSDTQNALENEYSMRTTLQDNQNRFTLANRPPTQPTVYDKQVQYARMLRAQNLINDKQLQNVILGTQEREAQNRWDIKVIDDGLGMKQKILFNTNGTSIPINPIPKKGTAVPGLVYDSPAGPVKYVGLDKNGEPIYTAFNPAEGQ